MTVQPDADNKHAVPLNFRSFESQVLYFNGMYKLPCPPKPTALAVIANERIKLRNAAGSSQEVGSIDVLLPIELLQKRLRDFKETLLKEITEVDDIVEKLATTAISPIGEAAYAPEDFLTDMADWLGDIQVYCASEMAKFGLPNTEVLNIIMQSNFSKLQLDGSTKYDAAGKVEKGPNYWKPEPKLQEMIRNLTKE